MRETAVLTPGSPLGGLLLQVPGEKARSAPPRARLLGGDVARGGDPLGVGHAGRPSARRPLVHALLALFAMVLALGMCSVPAYASTTITFPNGGTATLLSDGTIEGTCYSQRSTAFALYRDGDPNDPGLGVPTPFYITMPDGQTIIAYCQDKEHFAPRNGAIPFTAYANGRSYYVWVWGNRVDVNSAEVAAWASAGRSLYYPAQRLYASYWSPSIQGDVAISKTSASLSLTTNNASYTLEGAVYGVYSDASCTAEVARLETDASGKARSGKLDAGTYWIKEVSPSRGFALDPTVYTVSISAGSTAQLDVDEQPQRRPISLLLTKLDAQTHEAAAQGDASLEGAQFLVRFFGNVQEDVAGNPLKTWVFETDEDGSVVFDEEHLVSGDPFFFDENGEPVLPLGTLSVQELLAPEGYFAEGSASSQDAPSAAPVHVMVLPPSGVEPLLDNVDALLIDEQVKRGGIELDKDDAQTVFAQGDASLAHVVFEIVNRSAAHVVVDGVRYEPGEVVAVLETDDQGHAATAPDLLPYGTYEVREAVASTGYLNTAFSQTVEVRSPNTLVSASQRFTNDVMRGGVRVAKLSAETLDGIAQGGATLAGARFSVTTLGAAPVLVGGSLYSPGSVVATITTNEDGIAELPADALPYGRYEVREIEPPRGYLLNEGWSQGFSITSNGEVVQLTEPQNAPSNQVKRIGFSFNKVDEETMESMAGVAFVVTAQDDPDGDGIFEQHVIVTDENGIFDSEYAPHTQRTNANDAAWDPATDKVDSALLDAEAGLWFSGRSDRETAADDGLCALPYGTYTVRELACDANVDHALVSFTLRATRHGYTIARGTVDDKGGPRIATELSSEAGKTVPAAGAPTVLTDRVFYENLSVGKTYVFSGELVDGTTGEPLGIRSEREVTVSAPSGTVELEFALDAAALEATSIVAFEELHLDGALVAEHKDLEDEGQTVTVPAIATTLTGDEGASTVSSAAETIVLTDTVSYRGLWPGETYALTGELYNKATGEPLGITAQIAFTPQEAQGTAEVVFEVAAAQLAGKTVVCFESLERDGIELAVHADLEDEAQTVNVPRIATSLASDSGEKLLGQTEGTVTLVDTVSFEGLAPGVEHRLECSLVDKQTGEEIVGGIQTAFTPEDANGTAEVVFAVDAALLSGKETVAFEELYLEGRLVAVHADLEDEGQTVRFARMATTLTGAEGQTGTVLATSPTVLVDTVAFAGLKPGETYELRGTLRDKASGEPLGIEAAATLVPEQASGIAEVVFTCDPALIAGKEVVAFETLLYQDRELLVHADIEDRAQTIAVAALETLLAEPATGRKNLEKGPFKLVDTVSYSGLVPGETYTVSGRLMDKGTGEAFANASGEAVTGTATLVPQEASGTCEVVFEVDASAISNETELVAFEQLLGENGELLAVHEDIDNEKQTVKVTIPPAPPVKEKPVPSTGDETDPLSLRVAAGAGAAIAAVSTIVSIRTGAGMQGKKRKPTARR